MPRQVGRTRKVKGADGLNITSMMDMFTIILLFLLKSFSTDGSMLTNAEGLSLPNSISSNKPEKVNLQLAVTHDSIMIDDIPIEATEKIRSTDQVDFDQDTTTVMDRRLQEEMAKEEKLVRDGILNDVEGEIIIQLDKNINFDIMYKITRLCARNGYINMKYAVTTREE